MTSYKKKNFSLNFDEETLKVGNVNQDERPCSNLFDLKCTSDKYIHRTTKKLSL